MAWLRLLVCLAALLPTTLAMREAVLSRRSTLIAAVLAAAPVPRYSALRAEGLQTEGLQASRAKCRTLAIGEMLGESREACEARVADTPQQSMLTDGAKTSPLIEQLKQRTAANKEYNSRYVKVVTAGAADRPNVRATLGELFPCPAKLKGVARDDLAATAERLGTAGADGADRFFAREGDAGRRLARLSANSSAQWQRAQEPRRVALALRR